MVIVMLGLPDSFESEGFDRTHMNLPENQNLLMAELTKTGKPIVAAVQIDRPGNRGTAKRI